MIIFTKKMRCKLLHIRRNLPLADVTYGCKLAARDDFVLLRNLRVMSLMIYTADLALSDPAVCKLGACEGSNDLACQLVKEYGSRQNKVSYRSAALYQDSVFAFLMTGRVSMVLIEREMTSFESVPYRKLLHSPPFAVKIALCVPVSANEDSASA
jgi:hypothetical protein